MRRLRDLEDENRRLKKAGCGFAVGQDGLGGSSKMI